MRQRETIKYLMVMIVGLGLTIGAAACGTGESWLYSDIASENNSTDQNNTVDISEDTGLPNRFDKALVGVWESSDGVFTVTYRDDGTYTTTSTQYPSCFPQSGLYLPSGNYTFINTLKEYTDSPQLDCQALYVPGAANLIVYWFSNDFNQLNFAEGLIGGYHLTRVEE